MPVFYKEDGGCPEVEGSQQACGRRMEGEKRHEEDECWGPMKTQVTGAAATH